MPRELKSWDSQSRAWRAKQSAAGMTRSRYEKFRKLAPSTRAKADVKEYAAGSSVRESIRSQTEKRVIKKMLSLRAKGSKSTPEIVKWRVSHMSTAQVKWTDEATLDQIRDRARTKFTDGLQNPWYYK